MNNGFNNSALKSTKKRSLTLKINAQNKKYNNLWRIEFD